MADITTGLVGWWKFEEGSGTTAIDSSGNGNTGTLNGGATYDSGKIGAFSLKFNGVNGFVSLSSNPISIFSSANSICFWAKITDNTAAGSSGYSQTVIGLYTDANNFIRIANDEILGGYIAVTYNNAGTIIGAATGLQSTSVVFNNNKWVHVCNVFNGTSISLYINGTPMTTTSSADGAFSTGATNIIGGRSATTGEWGGSLDDIRIYNRALSANDVMTLYQQNVGLLAMW